jgi:hypothetical protein
MPLELLPLELLHLIVEFLDSKKYPPLREY